MWVDTLQGTSQNIPANGYFTTQKWCLGGDMLGFFHPTKWNREKLLKGALIANGWVLMIQALEPGVLIYIYIYTQSNHSFLKEVWLRAWTVPIDRLQPSAYFPGFFDKNVSSPSIPSISEFICSSHGLKDKSLQAATISCSEGQIALRRCFLFYAKFDPLRIRGSKKPGFHTGQESSQVESIV